MLGQTTAVSPQCRLERWRISIAAKPTVATVAIAEIAISTRRGVSDLPWPNLLRPLVFILKIGYHPKTRIFDPCAEGWLPVRNRCFGSVQANAICSQCRIPWFVRSEERRVGK